MVQRGNAMYCISSHGNDTAWRGNALQFMVWQGYGTLQQCTADHLTAMVQQQYISTHSTVLHGTEM